MAEAATAKNESELIVDWVIDADAHVTEPPDLFTSRLPKKWHDQVPHVYHNEEMGLDVWRVGEQTPIAPLGHTAVAGWPEPFPSAPPRFEDCPVASYDANARLAYMDSLAIWAMAIYPNVGGFGSQSFLGIEDPKLKIACVKAYNDFLTDWCSVAPERFIPITALPFWDVEESIKEIERCVKMGHKGILFSGEPHTHGQPVLGNPHWNPLWDCAQSLELPISFHIGSGDFTGNLWTPERLEHYGMGGINGVLSGGLFLDNGKQILDLLFSGVLPRYPDLKFVSVESGIGFIPFILETADYMFGYGQVRQQRPEFKMLPSEYFQRQVYGCYFYEEYAPQNLLDKIPADNILFETDYPHPVCLYGNVREKIDAGLKGATQENRRKMLFDNAARLYKVGQPDRPPTLA